MNELCVHRAKTYAFKLDSNDEVRKAKVLFNKVPMIKSRFGFRSRNHEIYTEKINKNSIKF